MGADDLLLSLEVELDQVPSQDKQKDEKEQENDDLHGGKKDVSDGGGGKFLRFADKKLDGKKEDDEQDDECPDEPRALFLQFLHRG